MTIEPFVSPAGKAKVLFRRRYVTGEPGSFTGRGREVCAGDPEGFPAVFKVRFSEASYKIFYFFRLPKKFLEFLLLFCFFVL